MKKILVLLLMICAVSTVYTAAPPPPAPRTLQAVLQGTLNQHANGEAFDAPGISAQAASDATHEALTQLWPSQLRTLRATPNNRKVTLINQYDSNKISEGCLNSVVSSIPDSQKDFFKTALTAAERQLITESALYHATPQQIDKAILTVNLLYCGLLPTGVVCILLAAENHANKDKSFYAKLLKPILTACHNNMTTKTVCGTGITGLCLLSTYQTGLLNYLNTHALPPVKQFLWNHRTDILWAPVNAANTFAQNPGKCLKLMSWPAVILLANWIARGDKSLIGHACKHYQKGILWSAWDQVKATGNGTLDLFTNPTSPNN